MNPFYPPVAIRANHHCEYCHAPEAVFNLPFEVDHIFPPGLGGKDTLDNLALACRACNLWKSDNVQAIDPQTGEWVSLFSPRQQQWQERFAIADVAPYLLSGKTATGRATIEQLKMNSSLQLVARARWVDLGLFP